jgi:dienelactone hydrolase
LPFLPDPLTLSTGDPVTSPEAWTDRRRPEILELFRAPVYGRAPVGRPEGQSFAVKGMAPGMMDGRATRKEVVITLRGPGGELSLDLLLFVPEGVRPAPAFLFLCNRYEENVDPTRRVRTPFWPAEEIVARGYAAAAIRLSQIDPDEHDGFRNGVHGLFDRERGPDSWGTLAAWAWGASRAMDYLETDPDLDPRRIAVAGHSRGGKTALWAGAEDGRFALAVSNNSGCAGAALERGKRGERIADITRAFPHWLCENYARYANREDDLPVDQHMLLALMAPRPVYVASAAEDAWADPESEFAACVAAEPVYRLFGLGGVGRDRIPAPDAPLHDGVIGYHLRPGGHDLTPADWGRFMDFADRQMEHPDG